MEELSRETCGKRVSEIGAEGEERKNKGGGGGKDRRLTGISILSLYEV